MTSPHVGGVKVLTLGSLAVRVLILACDRCLNQLKTAFRLVFSTIQRLENRDRSFIDHNAYCYTRETSTAQVAQKSLNPCSRS
ncbi:hypothetical protein F5Y16DRAFT_371923 [Xylariaceae sp. FL0255]|nr:hypothetical protein F5Y16DRAFT_371923 [Xylariaceae sp. FL0255]